MRKIITLLVFFLGIEVSAQTTLEISNKMQFAGLDLKLCDKVRDNINAEVASLTKNNKYFRQKVERADAYFHIIEKVFAEEGVPDDLKFLVLQESGLISDAVSTSNAVGFWQFKKATGVEMGLRVDDDVDERMNIVASTRAAAKYFKRHNFYMRNWVYAVLSHYAGLSGAKSIADPQYIGATDKMELDEKTHWYVMKYLSHKAAFEPVIHLSPVLPLKVLEYDDCEGKTLEQISTETNISLEDLKFYNKWLKTSTVPNDKDYVVLLPVKADEENGLNALLNKPKQNVEDNENIKPWKEKTGIFGWVRKHEPEPTIVPNANGEYVSEAPIFFSWNGIKAIQARKGDNIAKLALQADIDKDDFLEYNDLRAFDLIVRGQVYYIKKKHKRAKVPFHTVKDGETLWEVSQNYGITMKSLLKKNRMDKPEILKAGRILWLRRTRPEKTPVEYEAVPPAPPVIPLPKKPATDSAAQQTNKPATYTQPKAKVVPSTPAKIEFTLPEDSIRAAREAAVSDSILKADDIREQQEENSADSVQIFVAGGHKKKAEPKPETTEIKPVEKTITNTNPVVVNTPPVKSAEVNVLPFKEHKIAAGQTLFKIAKIYGVRIDSLVAWNNLDGSPLKLGQPLLIRTDKDIVVETPPPAPRVDTTTVTTTPKPEVKPVAIEKAQPTTTITEYIVKSGDTLFKIARENGVTVQQLKEWNNKTDFNVALGEKIMLKK